MVAGFKVAIMCFPLREWSNWRWSREDADLQYFAVGPMRFVLGRERSWLTLWTLGRMSG